MEMEEPSPPPAYYAGGDYGGDETLGMRLVDTMAGFARRLWTSSYTVLTVDLRRASITYDGPPLLRRRRRQVTRSRSSSPPPSHRRLVSSGHGYLVNERDAESSGGWADGVEATRAQARLKVMQVWELSTRKETPDPWRLNLGIGGEFEVDKGEVKPKLRLRAKHASLHLLPLPAIELRRKWPLPPSSYTHLGIDVRCRIPLASPDKMLDPASGPRLMVNVYNIGGTGIHFTPGGLLFEDNVIELGRFTKMRVAAALEFPRELPWSEEERPFKLEVRRVGIKARTL
ncbi:uncharacterized protein LOC9653329 [Selaginella moellendorffii]|nr:uncharacterized protein LOC9653329 [Selaginella moellendorffii]|eukprot:XP_002978122.2 uncharacterized protein LOC9653329 [Selaginella moellendorffii]